MRNTTATITGPMALGMRCEKTTRAGRHPVDRAARMYSRSLMERDWPRTSLATVGQDANPMAMTMVKRLPPKMERNRMINNRSGKAWTISTPRINRLSNLGEPYPAKRPTGSANANTTDCTNTPTASHRHLAAPEPKEPSAG